MSQTYQITETSPLLHDVNCVYCHVDLELNDLVVVCDECDSPHHQECWQTNNNYCAAFGCAGSGSALPSPIFEGKSNFSFYSIDFAWHMARLALSILILMGVLLGLFYLGSQFNISDSIMEALIIILMCFWIFFVVKIFPAKFPREAKK